ncbi:hypothetical protein K491DRAFT_578935, partial [Lophiostoma macrostomum CBS 122681]
IIRVHVGGDQFSETFQTYGGLLRKSSGYFLRALEGLFIEASTKQVNLPTEDPDIFRLFFRYLNTGRLYETQIDEQAHQDRPSFWTLFRLWVFADAHDIEGLEDIAISEILNNVCCNGFIPIDLILELEGHTVCGVLLYEMLVEL